MPKLTEAQLYELQAAVAKVIKKDMQSDDVKVRLPARSCAIKLLKNNRIKVNPMWSENMRALADEVGESQEWENLIDVPFLEMIKYLSLNL